LAGCRFREFLSSYLWTTSYLIEELNMRYMLFVATDPDAEPYDPHADNVGDWVAKHDATGKRVIGERLRPVEDATTVRRRGGKLLVTDGPFAETREWIAGFDVLECADLDEAIAIAAEHPMARFGRLELRPFWPIEEPEGRSE
jgi:hypothetical protein